MGSTSTRIEIEVLSRAEKVRKKGTTLNDVYSKPQERASRHIRRGSQGSSINNDVLSLSLFSLPPRPRTFFSLLWRLVQFGAFVHYKDRERRERRGGQKQTAFIAMILSG